ncbi:hypothetical protein [Streptomyces sp. NBC_01304]|uniref:hypothetical protein n=1 Tax=Streptomyces sp. NBC_01304 TaxID=2903818 RepID=UPI002E162E78|nr:hypothetical protein OG430_39045 [Streptomyces sp. NBC_01304]
MAITLTDQEKITLRTAAYGAVTLLAAADAAGSPHKIATQGSIALATATGPVGHILAERTKIENLDGKSTADIADRVLPALTETVGVLKKQDPAEADNFRSILTVAIESATQNRKGQPSPTVAEMTRKINEALDAG